MLPRAVTSPELDRLRSAGQWVELLACIPQPAIVFQAKVNGAPAGTDQLTQITYDTATGTLGDVIPGMTLWVGTSPGASDRGQARIRSAPTSSIFYIGSESEIDVHDNDDLTVVDEFGLWERQVRIAAGVIYMDHDVVYSNQNSAPLPVVVMGGPAVLELAGPSVTARFDASPSWVPGGGAATYLWTAPGAASTTGLTTATPTMSYTVAGRYRVSCTVTIGGVANVRYEYVTVFDAAHPPLSAFRVAALTGSKSQGGYSFQMTAYAGVDRATVHDRAQVILFTRDHYGSGGVGSVGYATGRENILCIGWIDGETIQWSPELSSVTFQVEGAAFWLGKINACPQGLEDVTATPTKWTDYQALTMTALVWCLVVWRSTVAQALDVYCEQSSTRTIELAAAATSLWEQLVVNAGQRLLAAPATDHLSRLFVLIDAQFRANRSGVAEVMTLTKADYRPPIALNRVTVPPVSMVDQSGFSWDGTNATALFSLSPGRLWKRYGRVLSQQALLLTDQAQANTLCGLIAGQANNEYPSVPVALAANNRMLDIAPDCYVKLTLAASETPRGASFTDRRFIVRAIAWSYDAASGGLLPTVTLEAETFAELAVTGDAPATEPVPPPPPPPSGCPAGYHPDPLSGLCVPDSGVIPGDGSHVTVATTAALGRTTNFLTGGTVNWLPVHPILTGGETIQDVLFDPYDPAQTVYLLTTQNLYKTTNYHAGGASPAWASVLTLAQAATACGTTIDSLQRCEATITAPGQIGVLAIDHSGPQLHYLHTHDGGASWSGASVGSTPAMPNNAIQVGGFQLSQHDANKLWVSAGPNGGATTIRASTDGGHSFGALPVTFAGYYAPLSLHVQYAGNDSDLLIYVSGGRGSTVDAFLYHSTDGLATAVDISPTLAHGGYTDGGGREQAPALRNLLVPVTDANRILMLGTCSTDKRTVEGPHVYVSTNGGASWSLNHSFVGDVNALGAWPWVDSSRLFAVGNATDGQILYSTDEGVSWSNKFGDWASAIGAWTVGVNVIPTWVAV